MHAVDTNVVVRCLTRDDPRQAPVARDFVDSHEVVVLSTVLIECEWVLRSVHRLPRGTIATLLRQFAGLPTVSIERPAALVLALEWFEQYGMDFADALHLAIAGETDCEAFATFDRKLAAAAKKAKAGKVKAL
ncbi:MAG TPA: type II toxin-antitoxin system VapC family toxin [Rhodanobacteraceae bacterium]